jgi:hypothetical protein
MSFQARLPQRFYALELRGPVPDFGKYITPFGNSPTDCPEMAAVFRRPGLALLFATMGGMDHVKAVELSL